MSLTKLFTLALFLPFTLAYKGCSQFEEIESYKPRDFVNKFDFFTDEDPTHGFVKYESKESARKKKLFHISKKAFRFGVDHKNIQPNGRSSIRLTSKKTFGNGLFILNLVHMPGSACGSWPAFWMFGPNWPHNGEIDIFEGVHYQKSSRMALHTVDGCKIKIEDNNPFTGSIHTPNCDINAAGQYTNEGCAINANDTITPKTFGTSFNENRGGVYATEYKDDAVKIWFFPREAIPRDIKRGKPRPDKWPLPIARLGGDCDIARKWSNMSIIFNTAFCGDWAGNTWSVTPECKNLAPTCSEYVRDNPTAFNETYWKIRYLKVYQHVPEEKIATCRKEKKERKYGQVPVQQSANSDQDNKTMVQASPTLVTQPASNQPISTTRPNTPVNPVQPIVPLIHIPPPPPVPPYPVIQFQPNTKPPVYPSNPAPPIRPPIATEFHILPSQNPVVYPLLPTPPIIQTSQSGWIPWSEWQNHPFPPPPPPPIITLTRPASIQPGLYQNNHAAYAAPPKPNGPLYKRQLTTNTPKPSFIAARNALKLIEASNSKKSAVSSSVHNPEPSPNDTMTVLPIEVDQIKHLLEYRTLYQSLKNIEHRIKGQTTGNTDKADVDLIASNGIEFTTAAQQHQLEDMLPEDNDSIHSSSSDRKKRDTLNHPKPPQSHQSTYTLLFAPLTDTQYNSIPTKKPSATIKASANTKLFSLLNSFGPGHQKIAMYRIPESQVDNFIRNITEEYQTKNITANDTLDKDREELHPNWRNKTPQFDSLMSDDNADTAPSETSTTMNANNGAKADSSKDADSLFTKTIGEYFMDRTPQSDQSRSRIQFIITRINVDTDLDNPNAEVDHDPTTESETNKTLVDLSHDVLPNFTGKNVQNNDSEFISKHTSDLSNRQTVRRIMGSK